jgi:hypothetical protein
MKLLRSPAISLALGIIAIGLSLSIDLSRAFGDYWKYLWEARDTIFVTGTIIAIASVFLGIAAWMKARRARTGHIAWAISGTVAGLLALPMLFVNLGLTGKLEVYDDPRAVASLRTIYLGMQAYAQNHPDKGFPDTLNEANVSGAIGSALANGTKSGYQFLYVPKSMQRNAHNDSYQIFADPIRPGRFSSKHFFMDQTGVVRFALSGRADASSNLL